MSGVFVEEMPHLALAANLLNVVGGAPRLDMPGMLPPHPRKPPHSDLEVSLVPFGAEAVEMFLRLEQPAPPGAPPEDDNYESGATGQRVWHRDVHGETEAGTQ